MTIYCNKASAYSAVTNVSTANSGGGGDNAFTICSPNNTAKIQASSEHPISGAYGYKLTGDVSATQYIIGWTGVTDDVSAWAARTKGVSVWATYYWNGPASNVDSLFSFRANSGTLQQVLALSSLTNNTLMLQNSASGAGLGTSPVLAVGDIIRVGVLINPASSALNDGKIQLVATKNGAAWWAPAQAVAQNTRNPWNSVTLYIGKLATNTTQTIFADDIYLNTAAVDLTDPATAAAIPTISLNADLTGVEPGKQFNLTATATAYNGATISSYNFSQTAGPTAPLTGTTNTRVGTGPANMSGTTLTYQATATDNNVLTSSPASVNVGILASTERAAIGGVEVPILINYISS